MFECFLPECRGFVTMSMICRDIVYNLWLAFYTLKGLWCVEFQMLMTMSFVLHPVWGGHILSLTAHLIRVKGEIAQTSIRQTT